MNTGRSTQENLNVMRQELITLTKRLDELCHLEKDMRDLKLQIKSLKLFLRRAHPGFEEEFPAIVEKMSKKATLD